MVIIVKKECIRGLPLLSSIKGIRKNPALNRGTWVSILALFYANHSIKRKSTIRLSHTTLNAAFRNDPAPSSSGHGAHHLPLFVQPTLRGILSTLQHYMVTLQSTREIVPGRSN
jgi:hypothetical protein